MLQFCLHDKGVYVTQAAAACASNSELVDMARVRVRVQQQGGRGGKGGGEGRQTHGVNVCGRGAFVGVEAGMVCRGVGWVAVCTGVEQRWRGVLGTGGWGGG